MRRTNISYFISILSLLGLWGAETGKACSGPEPTYNYYMFKVCPSVGDLTAMRQEALAKEWTRYTGTRITTEQIAGLARMAPEQLDTTAHPIVAEVRRRNDREMMDYLKALTRYCRINEPSEYGWEYPTKEELAANRQYMEAICRQARQYAGKRLAPQWRLLAVRTLYRLERWQELTAYWQNTVARLPRSVFRDMAEGFYAGALRRCGQPEQAAAIYAESGDMASAIRCMENPHSLSCIQSVYRRNPASPLLYGMVQTFVNNAQETLDCLSDQTDGRETEEWLKTLNVAPTYKEEVDAFIDFANRVAGQKKTASPALWKSAAAMLHYIYKDYDSANREIDEAMTMRGEACVKDNARAIRLLLSGTKATDIAGYSDFLAGELAWLDTKAAQPTQTGDAPYDEFAGHYERVKERIVYRSLVPLYTRWKKPEIALALMGPYNRRACLDTIAVSDAINFYRYLYENTPTTPLDSLLVRGDSHTKTDLCEHIGTKLVRLGEFGQAAKWFERVPLAFVRQMGIAVYMMKRNYAVARWYRRQPVKDEYAYGEEQSVPLRENQKLSFCKEMTALLRKYGKAQGETRKQLAYDLAVRYYQASYRGDCWYIGRYGKSMYDSCRVHETDFVRIAAKYLRESKTSASDELRMKSLYALAYVCEPRWLTKEYDDKTWEPYWSVHETSPQYAALKELHDNLGRPAAKRYVPRCDQLLYFADWVKYRNPQKLPRL